MGLLERENWGKAEKKKVEDFYASLRRWGFGISLRHGDDAGGSILIVSS